MRFSLDTLKSLVLYAIFAGLALPALAMAVIFPVFVWRMVSAERHVARFPAPTAGWMLEISESCLQGPCYKQPRLITRRGWFSRDELQCDARDMPTDAILFDTNARVRWSQNDMVVDWTAGRPPVSGQLDLRRDCYRTAIHNDRHKGVSVRFKETCLAGRCTRSADWITSAGGYNTTMPCSVTASGDVPVFTISGDARGQVDVEVDLATRSARWSSRDTGQSGIISSGTDCDEGRKVRKPQPP